MDRLIASNTVAVGSGDTAPATGTPGQATSGNPATNTPATVFPAYAWNAVQEELIAILVAAGITPDRTNNAQLASAIKRIGQNTVVLADTGAVNAYTATNATPLVAGTWIDGVVQAVKIAHTNTGASTYAPDGLPAIPIYGLGLQPLQGSELFLNGTAILMRATIAGVNSGNPICVLMECAGGAQQIPPATQPLHAMQLGQATGRLLNVQVFTSSGTYTPTSGATSIIVEGCGGGGGGGGAQGTSAGQASVGGGGGAGAWGWKRLTSGITSQTVTIGAGGAGGTAGASNGSPGGTTSFGALMGLPGGQGGGYGIVGTNAGIYGYQGAQSSVAVGTTFGSAGQAGGNGIMLNSNNCISGQGAPSHYAAGGQSVIQTSASTSAGVSGQGQGAGGSGAVTVATATPQAGGSGAAGMVIVYEYA